MGRKVKIAATCRKCGKLDEHATTAQTDEFVIEYIAQVLHRIKPKHPDLILFPEMCDLPEDWEMERYISYILSRREKVLAYIKEEARNLHTWIAFSTVRKHLDGTLRNSCILIDRAGNIAFIYDKTYPTLGELENGIRPGDGPQVFECELGRIGVAVCFDLNYLELAKEYKRMQVEILLFPALFHGGVQQQIWAFTTQAYFIGACGGCKASVVSPVGEILEISTGYFSEIVYTVNLDYVLVHLDFNWDKLEAITEKYADDVTIHDPGGLGAVLLDSQIDNLSMKEILKEFAVETLDEYLERMRCRVKNIV